MKKTLLTAALALSLCVPGYADSGFFNDDQEKYDAPEFGDEEVIETEAEHKHDRVEKQAEEKAQKKQLKEDKKAPAMPIRLSADHAEYDPSTGDFHASGKVRITQGQQTLRTDYANGNMKTGDVWIERGAELKDPKTKLRGEWAHYNFNSKTGELKELSGRGAKDYFSAPHATIMPDKVVIDQGGRTSRCPAVKHPPCLAVEAREMEYYPGEKLVAHDVKVFIRGKHMYSRDTWINRFKEGQQTRIMPRFGYDGKNNGAYMKLEIDQPLSEKTSANIELTKYSKAGYKPEYRLTHDEKNFRIKYFHGWDEDDEIWYKKQNDWRVEYKPHHIVDQLPISYYGYYERGLWNRVKGPKAKTNSPKSWHSEYAFYLKHDPIHLFSENTVLGLTYGKKWVRDSHTNTRSGIGDTRTTHMFYYTLGHKFSSKWRTWMGYYKSNRTSENFNIGQPDMEQEIRNGIKFSPDKKNTFTVVNRYDNKKHHKYETDVRWLHRFCCWAVDISYEREWEKKDHSFKVHYYFYNW